MGPRASAWLAILIMVVLVAVLPGVWLFIVEPFLAWAFRRRQRPRALSDRLLEHRLRRTSDTRVNGARDVLSSAELSARRAAR